MATLHALRSARELLELSLLELWIGYFSVGGNHDAAHLAAYLAGDVQGADPQDHDHIIDALNEVFIDRRLDPPLSYGTS